MSASVVRFLCMLILLVHHVFIWEKLFKGYKYFQKTGDPYVDKIYELGYRFLSVHNFILQTIYLIIILFNYIISKCSSYAAWLMLKWNTIFYWAAIYPATVILVVGFWTIYYIDRNLIYSVEMEQFIPPVVNTALHLNVLALIGLETVFLFHKPPPWNKLNKFVWCFAIYIAAVPLVTYYYNGVWLYEFMTHLNEWQLVILYIIIYILIVLSIRIGLYIQSVKYSKSINIKDL